MLYEKLTHAWSAIKLFVDINNGKSYEYLLYNDIKIILLTNFTTNNISIHNHLNRTMTIPFLHIYHIENHNGDIQSGENDIYYDNAIINLRLMDNPKEPIKPAMNAAKQALTPSTILPEITSKVASTMKDGTTTNIPTTTMKIIETSTHSETTTSGGNDDFIFAFRQISCVPKAEPFSSKTNSTNLRDCTKLGRLEDKCRIICLNFSLLECTMYFQIDMSSINYNVDKLSNSSKICLLKSKYRPINNC
ncbi:DgyrCDS7696 [Dimorphilus gyrociliatus]|uniref:DgyrCDS7696 n=1 Tax=Dimorphilus gyrociliatus TaxID=2664684 RepID=A0A7I8VTL2_9ANNE|nr:DgyrCDS7696 [Dimorphilus gyrociliatus]